jgi:hypothetical protein
MAYAVVNLNGLLNTLVTEIGEYKVYKTLKHDKNHGEAVAAGGMPENSCDIGSIIRLALHTHIDVSRPVKNGKPEISREQAGIARKWQIGGLRAECFFSIQPGGIYGILWALCGVCRTQSESIFVQ